MFPRVMERLELTSILSTSTDSDGESLTPFKDYLQHMAHLQQVTSKIRNLWISTLDNSAR